MSWKLKGLEKAQEEFNSCEKIENKDKKIDCMLNALYEITEKQDLANIHIIKTLNEDSDERWIPLHMMDNANAIILGISRNKGRPTSIFNEGYVEEKINSLDSKWDYLKLRKK